MGSLPFLDIKLSVIVRSTIFPNKTEKMPGFPESDVAQLTHEGNIVTWTLMKNEDGSFTQVILFALSDSDYFKV